MPAIIRWFKVTHDINADPEFWELREQYGDRAGFVWLEMLSIADRNRGLVGPDSDQTRNQLASKCRTSRVKVGLILGWCRVKGWLVSDDGLRIVKWSKYNKPRDDKKNPVDNFKLPLLDIHPQTPHTNLKDAPKAVDNSKPKLNARIKEVADKIYQTDLVGFKRLVVWIKSKQRDRFSDEVIALTLEQFEPHASKVKDWWPYLDQVAVRVRNQTNGKAAEKSWEQFKNDEKQWLREFLQQGMKGIG